MRKLITTLTAILAIFISTFVAAAEQLQVIRVNGLVEVGQTTLQDNMSYPIKFPAVIVSRGSASSISALLPNGHGIFIKSDASVSLDATCRERSSDVTSWIGLLDVTVKQGDFATCSPEKSPIVTYVRISARGAVILGSAQSTYAVLGDQLTVTRGSVDVHILDTPNKHVIVQFGESVILHTPLTVLPAKQSRELSSDVLEATVEACFARLASPKTVAKPIDPTPAGAFPNQPISADLVSPAS
jgi:hypothetical protein